MDVFVLGASGTVGAGVVEALVRGGHRVRGLARSGRAMARIAALGAEPVAGDLRAPADWLDAAAAVEAVVHCAATFDAEMAAVDRALLDALLPRLARRHGRNGPARRRLVYTGGVWLWGDTGGQAADENSPLAPPEGFAFLAEGAARVADSPGLDGAVVHPGLVCAPGAGPVAMLAERARATGRVAVIGGADRRWPLVAARDLGELYRRVLESGPPGRQWLGVAAPGVRQGDLADALATRLDLADPTPEVLDPAAAETAFGDGAGCYALDQVLSGERARRELGWAPAVRDWVVDALPDPT
jgi:nucleoside-diphosphate-sugar epimerase